jgi:glycosyltransferase involved in cell wall biosynthesis
MATPKIIIAFPAYNEEAYIGTLVLQAKKYAGKVIVVDDGGSDATAEVAGIAGAYVIRHSGNKGKGAAIQSILIEAKKDDPDVLIIMDADSQHKPDEIPRLVKPITEGYDLVIGSRKLDRQDIPSYRRFGQKILLSLTRLLTKNKLTDSESGFRAFSRKAINELDLSQTGFAVESEMIAEAEDKNLKVTEVPISAIYTKDSSTMNPVRHGLGVFTRILSMISERRPLLFFGVLGTLLTLIGLIAGIRTVQIFTEFNVLPMGTAMLAVLFFVIGVFCGFTAIILHTLASRK